MIYANICYQGKKYDRAIELYKESLKVFGHHSFFKNQVLSGIGPSYEKKKDYTSIDNKSCNDRIYTGSGVFIQKAEDPEVEELIKAMEL